MKERIANATKIRKKIILIFFFVISTIVSKSKTMLLPVVFSSGFAKYRKIPGLILFQKWFGVG